MNKQRIGIVGAGTMGSGIAQALSVCGHEVALVDVSQRAVERGLATITGSMERLVKRGKLAEADTAAALSRIRTSGELAALSDCDLIVEAASERLDLKLELFASLDALARPDAILASNTSSISITRLAAATCRPAQVVGLHFFNPVPVMALVEIICGLQTSDETYQAVADLVAAIGKTAVPVKNSPGFVVNRMLCPMINEAIFALGEGLASAAEIDDAMKLGANHPIGPLALCDMIGLDIELAVMQVLFESFKDPKYRPAPLLVEMVEAGYLGRKTGRGFFRY
ncbi:3-hydroxybutyryl-CoA dehydrogenase [Cupriavidus sp. SK-4]|uniref:3-hydroxybutyryl-CoA dehydrogenase n=1 Tax=Cupriavidus sp. SK-4 TaxID=574750 RepID=UPI00044A2CF8|nr:3-hydroxybutyryl-CoA dehydrogenase [Cupriavidus sp. SK-4]EYS88293.1 3-hydroxybutyryl-CoA dehydrogenase [Cupriavidus sp. SK-4]